MTYIFLTFEIYGAQRDRWSTFDEMELEDIVKEWFNARKAEVSIEPDPDIDDSEEAEE